MGLRWLGKFRIVFYALLWGGLWRLNEYYVWTALRGYSVEASNPTLEKYVWDVVPVKGWRFWPSFLSQSREMEAFLEKTLPVFVNTRMTGWGIFVTDIKRLSPWLTVEWKGQLWRISRDARMWSLSEDKTGGGKSGIPVKPLWRIVSSVSSADENFLPKGVFPSFFLTAPIDDFLERFGKESWFSNIEEIVLDRREGTDLFRLRFRQEMQEFEILIQKDKYEGRTLNLALEELLDRLRKEGGNYVIDATYENNRIVVRALPAAVGEGSRK